MQNSSSKLLYWAITCALAGFIFGFDLIVISGAEQKIQSLWGLSGLETRLRHECRALGDGFRLDFWRRTHR